MALGSPLRVRWIVPRLVILNCSPILNKSRLKGGGRGEGGSSPADQIVAGVSPVHRDVAALQLVARRLVALQVLYQDVPNCPHVVGGWLCLGFAGTGKNLKKFQITNFFFLNNRNCAVSWTNSILKRSFLTHNRLFNSLFLLLTRSDWTNITLPVPGRYRGLRSH